jgi:flagellar M-ring protein FliF
MDFLNKAYGQVGDLFKSMTPGSRITAGMLIAMIVVSLIYLFAFRVHPANEYLLGARQFSRGELAELQSAFAAAGLSDFEIIGNRIRVPRRKMIEYLQSLSQNEVKLADFDSAIDEALANANSLIDSRQVQDFRFSQAAQKKLAHWFRGLAGIDNATVHFQEVRQPGWPPTLERRATVAVEGAGGRPLSREMVRTIRTTASGFFGITPEDVTITDLSGNQAWGGDAESREYSRAETVYADTKRMHEEQWQKKIYDCLTVYPGVVVGVNVELDPELATETTKVTVDTQPTAVESNTYRKVVEGRPAAGGRPGAVPNEVPSNSPRDIAGVAGLETSLDENRERQVSVAGHEQTTRRRAPLIPTSVTATVWIPESYFRTVWHQRNPVVPGEEPRTPDPAQLRPIEQEVTKKISDAIVALIPPPASGDNTLPQVHVTSYEDIPNPPLELPSTSVVVLDWLTHHWQTIGLLLVALAGLLMLRSMIRVASPGTTATPVPFPVPLPAEEAESRTREPVVLHRRTAGSGGNLREELTAMVREDPDAAANVLRTWIGDAA